MVAYYLSTFPSFIYLLSLPPSPAPLQDKKFPIFGYGASFKHNSRFPSYFNLLDALKIDPSKYKNYTECEGIAQVHQAYRDILPGLTFGDMGSAEHPHNKQYKGDDFYDIIKVAAHIVESERQKYSIVVLIIDGDCFDNAATIDAIVDAGDSPVSLIIVGVGNNCFENCKVFDADDIPLRHTDGRVMKRDIIQFVKFDEYKHDNQALAQAVLSEVPYQIVCYMEAKGIKPNTPGVECPENAPAVATSI